MINDIVSGIALKLKGLFPGYSVYDEDVRQGLKIPCFYLALVAPVITPRLGTRKMHRNTFDIHYFPQRGNQEMYDIAGRLITGLEYITLSSGAKVRGTNMNYEIVDGVLHFFINYNVFTGETIEKAPMESAEIKTGTKG